MSDCATRREGKKRAEQERGKAHGTTGSPGVIILLAEGLDVEAGDGLCVSTHLNKGVSFLTSLLNMSGCFLFSKLWSIAKQLMPYRFTIICILIYTVKSGSPKLNKLNVEISSPKKVRALYFLSHFG